MPTKTKFDQLEISFSSHSI